MTTITNADFVSLDYSGAPGPRNADGSLPTINFLRLAAGSDLIDKGIECRHRLQRQRA